MIMGIILFMDINKVAYFNLLHYVKEVFCSISV